MNKWKPVENGCFRRADGATVFPRKTMWGATGPGGSDRKKRWKTAEAAMSALDREFPCLPPKPRFPLIARQHMGALKLSTPTWIMGQHG